MLLIFEALCMIKINLPGSVLEEVNLKKKKILPGRKLAFQESPCAL